MREIQTTVNSARSSSKKRPSSVASAPSLQFSKKRVPLGDLTNSPSLITPSTRNSDHQTTCNSECIFKVVTQNSNVETSARPKARLKKRNKKDPENSLTSESTQNSDVEVNRKTECKLKISTKSNPENSPSKGSTKDLGLRKCSYSSSIYEYLHSLEMEDKRRCLSNYMTEVQTDISVKMREVLVDWLVEVAEEYKLVSDTLYLTVSYIDRFLSWQVLSRNNLQLLGVSCMLIASKYEEINPPHVEDFCYITDNTYTKEEVVNMEKHVLEFLNYEMSTPTTKNFLRILTKAAQQNCKSPDLQFEFLSCYLGELSLLDYRCLRFLPSRVAASAVFLSRFTIQPKMHPWFKCVATLSSPVGIPELYFQDIEE
ncbi:putative cyclin-A3-1 isoform X2 [Manihot esculenta]|uniref:putative cyclin-A3-1 isoform X2 n=1 Tax=Manihot esculenta TaxID=3983 RepID=UPI000B5D8DA9|nr:putative cyclin-A3-1 isoform X2 [Manihot esculenta]